MPDTHESMFWPFNAAENYVVVPEDNNCHLNCELIYNMVQYYQRPTIFEYRQQDEPQCNHSIPNSDDEQDQVDDMDKEFDDHQTDNVEPSSSSSSKPKCKQKHVYQAEQGYLVEEPTSESSEEDQEIPS